MYSFQNYFPLFIGILPIIVTQIPRTSIGAEWQMKDVEHNIEGQASILK